MTTNDLIPTLAIATLLIGVVAAVVGYVLFKRKAANRHPMEKSPDGAITRETSVGPIEAVNRTVPKQYDGKNP